MSDIYIVPDGGIANRMRAIVSGVLLSQHLRRKPVIVWHANALCNADIADIMDVRDFPAEIIRPSCMEYSVYYDLPRLKNLFLSRIFGKLKFTKCYYDSFSLLNYLDRCELLEEEIKKENGDVLIFSGQEFYDFDDGCFREMIKPSQIVLQRAEEILEGREAPRVAFQIRRTDNQQSIRQSPVALFIEKMETSEYDSFYLATDDSSVKTEIKKIFGDKVILNPSPARRNTKQGIIDAMAEIVIMSHSKKIYGSAHSSFPVMAARLGEVPLAILSNTI